MTTTHSSAFFAGLATPTAESAGPYRVYARPLDGEANWDDRLEELHEESSRTHFLDVWTRRGLIEEVAPAVQSDSVIADLGCSSGYLLADLAHRWPSAVLAGVDLVSSGLRKAAAAVPRAELMLADVTQLPFGDATVDVVVSANLLEHIPDDTAALREIARVLRPGGRASMIVPSGPALFDYYDRFLHHERRYGRRELASRARAVGLRVLRDAYVGSFVYPPFWAVKKRNRRRFDHLRGDALTERVLRDIGTTTDSRLGYASCALERSLVRRGVTIPFGIRSLVTVERPA